MHAHLKLFVGRELCDTHMGRRGQSKANSDSVTRLFSAPAPAPYIYSPNTTLKKYFSNTINQYSPMLILRPLPSTFVHYYSLKVFLHYY